MSVCAVTLARMVKDPPRWHPLLAAVEPEPGVWILLDSHRRPYGLVQIVKVDAMTRFRAEHIGMRIGYATTLREAVERVHAAEVESWNPRGVNAPPPTTQAEWMRDAQGPHDVRTLWLARIRRRYPDL